jgi:apolipoprotein N-acyltransferase
LNHSGYINAEVFPSKGLTPYMYFGDYPILMLIFSIMLFNWKSYKKYG